MQNAIKILGYPFVLIGFSLIFLYKFLISPVLPKTCRFYPTCSSYALQAIKSYGLPKGSILAAKRIARCQGKAKQICDYIPDNIREEFRWLI